jgi:hypothetical protein
VKPHLNRKTAEHGGVHLCFLIRQETLSRRILAQENMGKSHTLSPEQPESNDGKEMWLKW